MISKAKGRYLRLSPMKTRQVINLIRGKAVPVSWALLAQVNKGPAVFIRKILQAAVSNAKQKGLTEDQLYVAKITATAGPVWKRFRAATFGRATPILKRTTHLTIELDVITR